MNAAVVIISQSCQKSSRPQGRYDAIGSAGRAIGRYWCIQDGTNTFAKEWDGTFVTRDGMTIVRCAAAESNAQALYDRLSQDKTEPASSLEVACGSIAWSIWRSRAHRAAIYKGNGCHTAEMIWTVSSIVPGGGKMRANEGTIYPRRTAMNMVRARVSASACRNFGLVGRDTIWEARRQGKTTPAVRSWASMHENVALLIRE